MQKKNTSKEIAAKGTLLQKNEKTKVTTSKTKNLLKTETPTKLTTVLPISADTNSASPTSIPNSTTTSTPLESQHKTDIQSPKQSSLLFHHGKTISTIDSVKGIVFNKEGTSTWHVCSSYTFIYCASLQLCAPPWIPSILK